MSPLLRRAAAPAVLAVARLRRRPARWLPPALGIAVATAFACAVAGEGAVAGDRAARHMLAGLDPTIAAVRVSAQERGGDTDARMRALLARPGFGPTTKVILLQPLRLGGRVVRLAAITPLERWSQKASAPPAAPCTASGCPLLLVADAAPRMDLAVAGAPLRLAGQVRLTSAVPLGFRPPAAAPGRDAPPPLLLSGDADGLQNLPGLRAVYRTTTWLAPLAVRRLHSWQLAGLETRLRLDQADLLARDPGLSFAAPFDALDAARARADAAPRLLLLAAGGAAAVMVAFALLAAGALRADLSRELHRLQGAGATGTQGVLLAGVEAAGVSSVGVLLGAVAGIALVSALAAGAAEPPADILTHSLWRPGAALALAGGWSAITLLLAGVLLSGGEGGRRPRAGFAGLPFLAAVGALALAFARGSSAGGSDPLPVLLAPLCSLATGALVLGLTGVALRAGEHASRTAPLPLRLALVNLARMPAAVGGATAFLAVSIGLGAFALSYRATLERSAFDQASSQVPLDVVVSTGPSFAPPLEIAPPARWRVIAGGPVLPVRRTQASFSSGAETSTVPLVALPAGGLPLLHGWRSTDGSATRARLARELIPSGPVRAPGAALPLGARGLEITASAVNIGVSLTAVLRDGDGAVTALPLGALTAVPRVLRAALPASRGIELAALRLDEPAGLAATSGHQNAEGPAPETGLRASVTIAAVRAIGGGGTVLPIASWRARGAAGNSQAAGPGLTVDFSSGGQAGILRPPQPGDVTPLPVLADRATAAQAGRDGRLALTVDGVAVTARVVGRLRRFPTVGGDGGGFVVADVAALASRLDADAPGEGRPDELWLSSPHLASTRAALGSPGLAALDVAYRADIERGLRSDAVQSGVARTLELAALVAVLLAVAGLLTLVGSARDREVERDLAAQGMGPRGLRLDLRLRMLVVAALGTAAGLGTGVVLGFLAVAAVRGSVGQAGPSAPVVAVVPWLALALFGLGIAAVLGGAAWAATARSRGVRTR